ncbi:MAG: NERD domain-containing protein [Rhodoferax sp.]|nr:NERD domain-containing protein [Rhodoferax sp.]
MPFRRVGRLSRFECVRARRMIYKELDAIDWQDQSVIVRRTSEGQMPYYLRRFFGESADVDVLNQLCVTTGGVVTRIDHLLMHDHGLVVVDSHSVSGHLQVEDDGRWICLDGSQMRVIRSPITQAYEQALSLKSFLDKKVRQKGFFDKVELDVIVAVPDVDVIQWPGTGALVEVCNADAVPRMVNDRIDQYRRLGVGPGLLVAAQRRRLAEFLVLKHRPRLLRRPGEAAGSGPGHG